MKEFILSPINIDNLVKKISEKVLENIESQRKIPDKKQFLTVNEVCNDYNIAKPTLYALTSQRKIPHIKRCKRLQFEREEIEKWLLEGRKKTKSEIRNDIEESLRQEGGKNDA